MLNLIPVALQSTWDVYNNLRLNFRCYGLILETLETEVKNSRSALIELKLHRLKRANRTNCNYEFKTYKNTKIRFIYIPDASKDINALAVS